MEKTVSEHTKLTKKLTNLRKEKRDRIGIVVVYCFIAGIVMSQFLLIGATFWLIIGFLFIAALISHYRKAEAEITDKIQELEKQETIKLEAITEPAKATA